MFQLTTSIPQNCFVACSGGIDSMVLLDFVQNARKGQGKTLPSVVYFNHGTAHGKEAEAFVRAECKERNLELIVKNIASEKRSEDSWEEYWRNERYDVFNSLPGTVLTAHHLNDAVEWWVFTSLHGCGKLIPTVNQNVSRPLLATSKDEIISWANRKDVRFINDPSNESRKYARNIIRHDIMFYALKVNPGLETVVRKMYLK